MISTRPGHDAALSCLVSSETRSLHSESPFAVALCPLHPHCLPHTPGSSSPLLRTFAHPVHLLESFSPRHVHSWPSLHSHLCSRLIFLSVVCLPQEPKLMGHRGLVFPALGEVASSQEVLSNVSYEFVNSQDLRVGMLPTSKSGTCVPNPQFCTGHLAAPSGTRTFLCEAHLPSSQTLFSSTQIPL